jgi:hypothetical protein
MWVLELFNTYPWAVTKIFPLLYIIGANACYRQIWLSFLFLYSKIPLTLSKNTPHSIQKYPSLYPKNNFCCLEALPYRCLTFEYKSDQSDQSDRFVLTNLKKSRRYSRSANENVVAAIPTKEKFGLPMSITKAHS